MLQPSQVPPENRRADRITAAALVAGIGILTYVDGALRQAGFRELGGDFGRAMRNIGRPDRLAPLSEYVLPPSPGACSDLNDRK